MSGAVVDVVIIGAGVVGAAIARDLGRYHVSTMLLDAASDVGDGTSKANTAIWHTGFDATPDTLEARLVARGHRLLGEYAAAAGIPLQRTGALLVAWNELELTTLSKLAEKAVVNRYHRTRMVSQPELRAREPHLGPGALGALEVPDEGIICPWSTPIAFATEAVRLGVRLMLGARVTSVKVGDVRTKVTLADGGWISARWVINAAGLASGQVDAMFGFERFTITPRRGQLIVFDKLARQLVTHIVLPVPTAMGKGVLVAPTVFGNVMLGPTAEDLDNPDDRASTAEGMEFLLNKGAAIMPELVNEEVTAVYAGLRAASEHADYQLFVEPDKRYVCVGGIRSTGLTASLAISEYLVEVFPEAGLLLRQVRDGAPPQMPYLGEDGVRPFADDKRIAADPAYGQIVCFCERVTRGELRDALESDIPPRTLDGLRRRTRALNGRCQGFYCAATITSEFPLASAGCNTESATGTRWRSL